MKRSMLGALAGAMLLVAQSGHAALTVLAEYAPGAGSLVGLAWDAGRQRVWLYPSFGAELRGFGAGGELAPLVRPGESANDADVEIAPEALVLGATSVPAGSVLFINGETSVAEIYALDRNSGAVLATLTTGFGNSHVVGGAYHPRRDSFFLLQDKVPGGAEASLVAEIDAQTGAVLNSFQIASQFTVNYGDIEVLKANGNLLVVSSDEPRIAEFTPTGTLVRYHALPEGVTSLSGIGVDDTRLEAWVSGTGGRIWRLGNTASAWAGTER